jgi:hypothetical protein
MPAKTAGSKRGFQRCKRISAVRSQSRTVKVDVRSKRYWFAALACHSGCGPSTSIPITLRNNSHRVREHARLKIQWTNSDEDWGCWMRVVDESAVKEDHHRGGEGTSEGWMEGGAETRDTVCITTEH